MSRNASHPLDSRNQLNILKYTISLTRKEVKEGMRDSEADKRICFCGLLYLDNW